MYFADTCRQGGPDVYENIPDPIVGQDFAKARHAAPGPTDAQSLECGLVAKLGVAEEKLVVVVPGMAALVMRQREAGTGALPGPATTETDI